MTAKHITDAEFRDTVLKSEVPVLVDFWATWCPPCRQMGPIVDELADEYEGDVLVCKLDVDENPVTAQTYGVSSIPTFIIFKDGDIAKSFTGGRPKKALVEAIESVK